MREGKNHIYPQSTPTPRYSAGFPSPSSTTAAVLCLRESPQHPNLFLLRGCCCCCCRQISFCTCYSMYPLTACVNYPLWTRWICPFSVSTALSLISYAFQIHTTYFVFVPYIYNNNILNTSFRCIISACFGSFRLVGFVYCIVYLLFFFYLFNWFLFSWTNRGTLCAMYHLSLSSQRNRKGGGRRCCHGRRDFSGSSRGIPTYEKCWCCFCCCHDHTYNTIASARCCCCMIDRYTRVCMCYVRLVDSYAVYTYIYCCTYHTYNVHHTETVLRSVKSIE